MSIVSTNELINTIRKICNETPHFTEQLIASLEELERHCYDQSNEEYDACQSDSNDIASAYRDASDSILKAIKSLKGIQA